VALGSFSRAAPEEEQVVGQAIADDIGFAAPKIRRQTLGESRGGTKRFRRAQHLERLLAAIDQPLEVKDQAIGPVFIEQLVVDKDCGLTVERTAPDMVAGMAVFLLVPAQHRAELSAIIAEFPAGGALPPVNAETFCVGVVTDVARLNDDEILAVMGVRSMAVGGDLAANPAVIEWKGLEMLGNQDDRIALALVRAKCPRRHHSFAGKSERQAVIVQSRNELAVTHRPIAEPEILYVTPHQARPPSRGDRLRARAPQIDELFNN
jgi:hypothetical protein